MHVKQLVLIESSRWWIHWVKLMYVQCRCQANGAMATTPPCSSALHVELADPKPGETGRIASAART